MCTKESEGAESLRGGDVDGNKKSTYQYEKIISQGLRTT
jgi:hypothetical protein